jgi:hypothetical protein
MTCLHGLALSLLASVSLAGAALAQTTPPAMEPAGHDMAGMDHFQMDHSKMDHSGMAGMDDMAGMDHGAMEHMGGGLLGDYSMTRDASGTAWQPDSAAHSGWMFKAGGWSWMVHGDVSAVFDKQSGARGGEQSFIAGMIMARATRDVGPGNLTLRAMVSPDPFIGKRGYPLLFQTGETADGVHGLVDRQHPHDALGELSATYAVTVAPQTSAFVYAAYPGEPALGPAAFLHRASSSQGVTAPISHHWLDSTHVTFGVVTAGVVWKGFKLEGSSFTGREPDQHRWSPDKPRFDSTSIRLSLNPTPEWSLQISRGWLKSPEQLEPDLNQTRTTASATYQHRLGWHDADWQTTLAWGNNRFTDGRDTDAFELDSNLSFGPHVLFARIEQAQKDELFQPSDALAGRSFRIAEFVGGYVRYFPVADHLQLGLGAQAGTYDLPSALKPLYGSNPYQALLFVRLKIG